MSIDLIRRSYQYWNVKKHISFLIISPDCSVSSAFHKIEYKFQIQEHPTLLLYYSQLLVLFLRLVIEAILVKRVFHLQKVISLLTYFHKKTL